MRGLKHNWKDQIKKYIPSHPVWVRGLKPLMICKLSFGPSVAPRVGAWIETIVTICLRPVRSQSHPVWVRGLKPAAFAESIIRLKSHPVWVRGLKLEDRDRKDLRPRSHPVWVRGLKPERFRFNFICAKSHPVWVRGLKQSSNTPSDYTAASRTPCGCVD